MGSWLRRCSSGRSSVAAFVIGRGQPGDDPGQDPRQGPAPRRARATRGRPTPDASWAPAGASSSGSSTCSRACCRVLVAQHFLGHGHRPCASGSRSCWATSGRRSSRARAARAWPRRSGRSSRCSRGSALGMLVVFGLLVWRMRWVAGASVSACLLLLVLGLLTWLRWVPVGYARHRGLVRGPRPARHLPAPAQHRAVDLGATGRLVHRLSRLAAAVHRAAAATCRRRVVGLPSVPVCRLVADRRNPQPARGPCWGRAPPRRAGGSGRAAGAPRASECGFPTGLRSRHGRQERELECGDGSVAAAQQGPARRACPWTCARPHRGEPSRALPTGCRSRTGWVGTAGRSPRPAVPDPPASLRGARLSGPRAAAAGLLLVVLVAAVGFGRRVAWARAASTPQVVAPSQPGSALGQPSERDRQRLRLVEHGLRWWWDRRWVPSGPQPDRARRRPGAAARRVRACPPGRGSRDAVAKAGVPARARTWPPSTSPARWSTASRSACPSRARSWPRLRTRAARRGPRRGGAGAAGGAAQAASAPVNLNSAASRPARGAARRRPGPGAADHRLAHRARPVRLGRRAR